ncbi:TlpA family protein disulfide reductase [Zunongwangia sp.]|uniref:TlpA family protein disulfide reductase n=1 Tax=Zunongwangia sp. TaxID=1965325 RepID=UPI003AA97288
MVSCNDKDTNLQEKTYVGGKIINPTSDYVVITNNNHTDTLKLDKNNNFGNYVNIAQSGIYTFKHSPNSQVIYLEPGDSIVVWTNTLDFDQSINYSGKRYKKSNFLVNLFLENKKNNDLILGYYKIKPKDFEKISDSIFQNRLKEFNTLVNKKKYSNEFINIAKQSIHYELYDLRERYTYLIKKYYPEYIKLIPKNFNAYRKNIDFNNKELDNYYLYTNTIDDYLRTRAIEHCIKTGAERSCFSRSNIENIKYRSKLINKLSHTSSIKNKFLDILLTKAMTMTSNSEENADLLKFANSLDYKNIDDIKALAKIQENYFKGKSVADLTILDINEKVVTYKKIISKPTITFFWSLNGSRYIWQHKVINSLRNKYPEVDFIGINLDIGQTETWKKIIAENNYDTSKEFQIINRDFDIKLAQKYLFRLNFLDKNSVIYRGDTPLSDDAEFEEKIVEFINRK